MKKFIIWSAIMLQTTGLLGTQLEINVENIDTKRGGDIRVYIFEEKGYPKVHEDALANKSQQATKKSLQFKFNIEQDLKELAIKLYHDENGDGKVSKNWTGIYPKEGLGFSNNQKLGIFGPPNYKNSKLSKEQFSKPINISIIYP